MLPPPRPAPPSRPTPIPIPTRAHLRLQQLAWKALPHLLQAAVAPNSGSLHLPHDATGAATGAVVWQAGGGSTGTDGWPQDVWEAAGGSTGAGGWPQDV